MKQVISFKYGRLLTPIVLIEICLSVTLVLWGAYTLSPLYKREHYDDAWSNLFDGDIDLYTAGTAYVLIGLIVLIGHVLNKPRIAGYGMGLTFMAYLYLTLAKFLVTGVVRPAYWMFYLALAFVAAVCYLWERNDGDN